MFNYAKVQLLPILFLYPEVVNALLPTSKAAAINSELNPKYSKQIQSPDKNIHVTIFINAIILFQPQNQGSVFLFIYGYFLRTMPHPVLLQENTVGKLFSTPIPTGKNYLRIFTKPATKTQREIHFPDVSFYLVSKRKLLDFSGISQRIFRSLWLCYFSFFMC